MTLSFAHMPNFQQVYEALKSGQHLCIGSETDSLWKDYRQASEDWKTLFGAMGHVLEEKHGSFCYLAGKDLARSMGAIAVVVLILIRHLVAEDVDPQDAILDRDWSLAMLPHLSDDRHREVMRQIEVVNQQQLAKIVIAMRRYGFVDGDVNSFRFTLAVRRIFDLCLTAEGGGIVSGDDHVSDDAEEEES